MHVIKNYISTKKIWLSQALVDSMSEHVIPAKVGDLGLRMNWLLTWYSTEQKIEFLYFIPSLKHTLNQISPKGNPRWPLSSKFSNTTYTLIAIYVWFPQAVPNIHFKKTNSWKCIHYIFNIWTIFCARGHLHKSVPITQFHILISY